MMGELLLLKSKTVLFAEDDKIIKSQITEVLEMIFKKVFSVEDGKKAYEVYQEERPDIIISDIKMPNIDGLTLIEKIRQTDYKTPIILLTSFMEQQLVISAANLSIDGYIIKPIEFNKLIVAINKAMKRVQRNDGLISLCENIFYNSATQELFLNGSLVPLGIKELELIKLLIINRSKTVTKEEISQTLWPLEAICESAIKNLVLRIRKKLNNDIIVSVRGIGYRLNII